MRQVLMLAALIGMATLATAQDKKPAKYVSEDGKFKLAFPGKVELNEQESKAGAMPLTFKMATWSSAKGDQAVIVSYVDYKLEDGQTFDPEKGLNGGVIGATQKPGREVVGFVGKIEFGKEKLPGRIFDMKQTNPAMYGKNLLVMKGTRLYHVIVVGDEEFALGKKGREIVYSFELTK